MTGKTSTRSGLLTRLGENSLAGLLIRVSLVAVMQILVLFALVAAVRFGVLACPMEDLLLVFGMMLICQIAGQIVAERPQGNDWIMLRLVGSLSVRTLFPLILIFLSDLTSEGGFLDQALVPIFVFYFFSSVYPRIYAV